MNSDLLSSLTSQGMYAVSEESTTALLQEYDETLKKVDELNGVSDPDVTPFVSKYEARKLMDATCNKLEATKTVAMLEKKREVVEDLDWRIACLRLKLGSLGWEVEEPHSAQIELDLAIEYYFPGFLDRVNLISGELTNQDEKGEPEDIPDEKNVQLPDIIVPKSSVCVNAMQCLNMLGILWAGRGHNRRSFIYFFSAKEFYNKALPLVSTDDKTALESLYTHNLFYLAQAYGNNGESALSCKYCHETLQRQYKTQFRNISEALDWVKNCSGIADFYYATGEHRNCMLALQSAEKVLKDMIPAQFPTSYDEGPNKSKYFDINMDLHRRYIKLDVLILKYGAEAATIRKYGGDTRKTVSAENNKSVENVIDPPPTEFFQGLPVLIKEYADPAMVFSYEDARAVFLRAAARIETCKKHFVMDGYVTDHVNLVEDNSKLYLHLGAFEGDLKRRLAMQSRRADMLLPILGELSRTAFQVEHKQISYELGEIFMNQHEMKTDKLRNELDNRLEISALKKSDIAKFNELCRLCLCAFTHFIYMYAPSSSTVFNSIFPKTFEMNLEHLLEVLINPPLDEEVITSEEVRPYLNAHFLCCRVLSKIIVPNSEPPHERSKYIIAAMKKYEWLAKRAPELCKAKKVEIEEVFGEELQICVDMTALLPSKINRIHYRGEDAFNM